MYNNQLKFKTRNFSNEIRILAKVFRISVKNIKLYNEIFGWQILGSIMFVSILLLIVSNFFSIYFYDINIEIFVMSPTILFFGSLLHGTMSVS